MHFNKMYGDQLSLRYPSSFNPWTNPEFTGRILFVGGIHKSCDQRELHDYLKVFDEVIWLRIEIDPVTGLSKGHAFTILSSKIGQDKVLNQKKHKLRDLHIGISVWKSSKEYLNEKDQNMKRKIFIKRLASECTESDLIEYFSLFGPIEKAEIRRNHSDNSSRKIAFLIFEHESDACACLNTKMHSINGRDIIVKRCRNPTEVKKERSLMLDETERHNSVTYSEESMVSHDWSFFTVPHNASNNLLNGSFSLKENDDQPSFNISSNSFFVNNVSKLTNTSLTETWIKGVVPIEEEDETTETNFSPNFGIAPISPTCLMQAKEYSVDFFFIEPRFKTEARVAFYTFPGYV